MLIPNVVFNREKATLVVPTILKSGSHVQTRIISTQASYFI